jgi:hypothetical protein
LKFQVLILKDAEDDIFDIYRYVMDNDSKARARYVVDSLKETILSLELPSWKHCKAQRKALPVTSATHPRPLKVLSFYGWADIETSSIHSR